MPVFIYISGPYTLGDPVLNSRHAMAVWHDLFTRGYTPFCPHWSIAQHMLTPLKWEEWMAFDLEILARFDAVYRMPGESKGADMEVVEANRLGIPVFYSVGELLEKLPPLAQRAA